MLTAFVPMTRTAYDHPDFKHSEQQNAVGWYLATRGGWCIAYELIGIKTPYGTIGDAGRRMRELREMGILESRKRGRYEEYRVKPPAGKLF